MSLHVHRSQRVEALVGSLHDVLLHSWPADPFAAVPIVVGSRGMGRWLRHELATRARCAALIDFLFPRNAFEAAAAWLLRDPRGTNEPDAVFWSAQGEHDDPWSGSRLVARVLRAIRAQREHPALAPVRRYLDDAADAGRAPDGSASVGAREITFAAQVAAVIERLHYDRPDDALAWSREPTAAPDEVRWVAELVAALAREDEVGAPAPAERLAQLEALSPVPRPRLLHVFGLSTLRPGDKRRLRVLARHLEVHLYVLVPSTAWWGDLTTRAGQMKVLRDKLEQGGLDALDRAEVDELFGTNELLAANGGPSRDLQVWLEGLEYLDHDVASAAPAGSLLAEVQGFVDRAEPTPQPDQAPWQRHRGCSSLEIHACHGPLRQCEALRDELLRRFAADPTLEPRHVLVTTPDIATYAPLVAAVLSRRSAGGPGVPEVPAIPVHVADLGLSSTNPVADALLRALALADERIEASALLGMLALWPVRERFGLAEDDLADVRDLIVGSGVRWAWDALDRAAHDQPKLDQNTIRFGMERLALGVLMPDDDPLGVLEPVTRADDTEALGPSVPFDVAARDRVARFGKLAAFCAALDEQRQSLREPATPSAWLTRLRRALDALTHVPDDAAWLTVQVSDTLEERLPSAMGDDLLLDRAGVQALLVDAFELPAKGDRPITGAVTVCAIEPMRSVPFRVIAMLGLDDGAFPRAGRPPAWDPFGAMRPGEHDRRTLDRHLFLESLLCARDALLLFGSGFEPKRGQPEPLAVVAVELDELLARGTGRDAAPGDADLPSPTSWPTRRHPLQPWSERAFPDDEAASGGEQLPFDPVWYECRAALAARPGASGANARPVAASRTAAWPPEAVPRTTLRADELAAALINGPKELLKQRLGIPEPTSASALLDREPIELVALDGWGVRDRALDALLEDEQAGAARNDGSGASNARDQLVDRLHARLRGEGSLPLHAGGRAALEGLVAQARTAQERAQQFGPEHRPALVCQAVVDELTLSAVIADVRVTDVESAKGADAELELVWTTASAEPTERSLLTAWISLLVARAAGTRAARAHVVGVDSKDSRVCVDTADEARARLAALVALWRRCRAGVVPLFPKFSCALAEKAPADPGVPLTSTLAECADEWDGTRKFRGARDDPWVSMLYHDVDVEDLADAHGDVLELARQVWCLLPPAPKPPKPPIGDGDATPKRKSAKPAPDEADEAPAPKAKAGAAGAKKARATSPSRRGGKERP